MEYTVHPIKGDTYYIKTPGALLPYYRLSDKEIILLDSGSVPGALEDWADAQGITVRAVINSHAHWDHISANGGLQKRQGTRVYVPKLEAAMASSYLGRMMENAPGNYYAVKRFFEQFAFTVDEEIGPEDGTLTVCGIPFDITHTPGHSADHIIIRTPDNVLYLGDLLMSRALLRVAKLNYAVSHEVDLQSKEKIRGLHCDAYVTAHKSVETEIESLLDENIFYVKQRADQVLRMITGPMAMDDIIRLVWRRFELRDGSYHKNTAMSHMVRALVQYLTSEGKLISRFSGGVDYYAPVRRGSNR